MVSRSLLLLMVFALGAAGCRRLNPAWCSSAVRCFPDEVCDPATNTCLKLEMGVSPEARLPDLPGDLGVDAPRPDLGAPDLPPPDVHVESCTSSSNGWVCSAGIAYECSEAASIARRKCPLGECDRGHCEPPEPQTPCKRDADCKTASWVCTLLLDKGQPKAVCAATVIGLPSPAVCTSGLDCASGLCTSSGQCYHACDVSTDCNPSYVCKSGITILVEGVSTAVKTCELP